ncbi:hypothetical protein GCM10022393_09250 [Aquimarina addita]|uniref:MAM domain-containing protein n=2 Tax=Aquimarina addita TaxID=870485 RepID=A0ABP7XCF1_9FLAO
MDGIVQNYLNGLVTTSKMKADDVSEWKVTNIVPSLNPEIQHVYLQQYHLGIPIQYATYKLTVKNNEKVTWEINQFVQDIQSKVSFNKSSLSPEAAIMKVAKAHGLQTPALSAAKMKSSGARAYEDSGIALQPIEAMQVYVEQDGKLNLTWRVSIYQEDGQHWWNVNVDAASGEILHTEDWVISCNFGTSDHTSHDHGFVKSDEKSKTTVVENSTAALAPDSYNVYAMPIESPNHGDRSIVVDPANLTASPFGWHDTNGVAGAEFTITRGNNVWAQEDTNGNNGTGSSPSGGASLDFNFPLNLSASPSTYLDAAITNLFYWNNIMHDVFYQYGFDEASGNFQENNYGNGGAGSDSVNADAQDGISTNNANFSTPSDGGNPRMQMFLFTNPTRDGDLDSGIIAHEYGHGISTRLVGGPGSNVLGGSEQMGEGWSDWFGLMVTMKEGDVGTTARGMGTYAIGQTTSGGGIRPTAYSTDTSINGTDYGDIGGLSIPHGVGYGFATILWDMTWLLIDEEGFDEDIYNGTGGNNIALALVIEGLKNTANNPGFVSGRDGILQADQDLYGGQYNCLIWTAFSARGVGLGANENTNGGTNTSSDQSISFVNGCDDVPPPVEECEGDVSVFPFSESFETNIGEWSQAASGSADDLDWARDSGGTPSTGTGPSSGADGTFYLYVEASGNGTGFPNKTAILNSPCLDFSTLDTPSLTFQYHMYGSAIESLAVEARIDNSGDWISVFSVAGDQGDVWNTAEIDLFAYAEEGSVQLRFNAVTGDGTSGWQSDIAIDAVSIQNSTVDPPSECEAINFDDFQIIGFSNQDASGDFSAAGTTLSLQNNTWKYIALDYIVTASTVIEFDFSSTSQGEIHGIGFEDDNTLTSTQYFKVHGTQNYSLTNYDNYVNGTTTYVIPVGDFYTGSMDRLVFINDNDAGSGNNSVFSNVKIYEGSCNDSVGIIAGFGKSTPILGDEDEGVISAIQISPNPLRKGGLLEVHLSGKTASNTSYSIINMVGQIVGKGMLDTSGFISMSGMETGMYMLSIQNSEMKEIKSFIIE